MALAVILVGRWMFSSGGPSPAEANPSASVSAPSTAQPAPKTRSRGRKINTASRSLDPSLRYDWLKASEDTKYQGKGRNIFRAQIDIPRPVRNPATDRTPIVPPQPTGPPPPPPINLKFFGFASKPGEPKKIFLSQGEDVFIAGEGAGLEELENNSNLRLLREQYEDAISGENFKLLHLGVVQVNFGAAVAGATSPGADPGVPTLGGVAPIGLAGAQSSQPSTARMPQPGAGVGFSTGANTTSQPEKNTSDVKLSSQVFGGGPIVGVVSTSKDSSIREFNKKKHYDQWQFIYDPSTDRGGLLNTPMQPPLQGATQNLQPGAAGGTPTQPQQQPQPLPQPQAEQPQAEPPQ